VAAYVATHATASTFLFRQDSSGWQLGLIRHPIWGKLMTPGGHVESGEQPHEAALREIEEEAGIVAELVMPHPPARHKPERHRPLPWWLVQVEMPRDNGLNEYHYHLDHVYVAVAKGNTVADPELPLSWHSENELPLSDMLEYSTSLASYLFETMREQPERWCAGQSTQP